MEVKILNKNEVCYDISWSKLFEYDRISATRILPELSGIICIYHKIKGRYQPIMFFACWRDGCRVGLKKLLDEFLSKHQDLRNIILQDDVYYKYAVVDTKPKDMKDVMFWLIQEYKPALNDYRNYTDSKRYRNIYVKETFE